jgi:SAM-dependent methyltransferase
VTISNETYDAKFFSDQVDGSSRSASIMVPWILNLCGGCKSVVDVGCGTGAWLAEYERNGIEDYLGIDGHLPEGGLLKIPNDRAMKRNLTQPLNLDRRFDIAQSLEVAEHLPASAANTFVDTLVALSDMVVFGAAIPGQGGTHHINEQWQSYWWTRFEERGYVGIDALKGQSWYESRVMWWYAQNTMVFVNRARPELVEEVRAKASQTRIVDVVHPNCFRQFRDALEDARKQLAAAQGGQQARVAVPTRRTSHDYALLLEALPRRFKDPEWVRKLGSETRPWKAVMFRHPLRVAYWWDLYRVQRRRKRAKDKARGA